ncbi:MAG: dihydroorotate dehydrogenase electron transfer subunit [Lachnospiraceae bacterium]|nr:dihydroorotate dehydrogenase electron transfer subunit [Lachnospiraceae bacterium]
MTDFGRTPKKQTAVVLSQQELSPGIFDMWIGTDLVSDAAAGRFIGIYPADRSRLLPRPVSICEIDREKQRLRVVYRVAGGGTEEFSTYSSGQAIEILGILGNGFPIEAGNGKTSLLIGGGIGIPPMLQLAKELKGNVLITAGYRDHNLFLAKELELLGRFYPATEDGSAGTGGTVLDAIAAHRLKADVIYACGPLPMLRAVKQFAATQQIPAYLSMEERMACGVGACLGCVCRTTKKDPHSHVYNARICTDGPVFLAEDVEI